MKHLRPALNAFALAALLSGCSSQEEHAVEKTAPTPAPVPALRENDRENDLRAVIAMRRRGELDDAQAISLVATMLGVPSPAAAARLSAPVTPVVNARQEPEPARVPVTGRLRSVGSDSMDRIMEDWETKFAALNPGLRVSHEGKGSATAVPALIDGRADFGPMSRPLKSEEIARFGERFGYAPTQIRVALDTVAVYVNPSNPIAGTGLTMQQLDAVFSANRKRGGKAVTTWGDLGLEGEWKSAPVRVYSRNSASGTHAYFRDEVLAKGEFRGDAAMLAGSEELVRAVGADKFAIGYSGIGFRNASVAVVDIAEKTGSPFREPNEANAISGVYPIARGLYMTINRNPAVPASDMQREFLRYVLGPEGQRSVMREGYFAVPANDIPAELAKLGS